MKLHTDRINAGEVFDAAREAGVTIHGFAQVGSRTHARGFIVYLEGSSTRQSNGRDHKAATWDEWGVFMAALYRLDYSARWGTNTKWGYRDAADFHWQTSERFRHGIPQDTHAQHKWQYSHKKASALGGVSVHECTRCSAERKFSH